MSVGALKHGMMYSTVQYSTVQYCTVQSALCPKAEGLRAQKVAARIRAGTCEPVVRVQSVGCCGYCCA